MRFLPVFLDVRGGVVGLVGSGAAARSKLRLLLGAGATVRWYGGGDDRAPDGNRNAFAAVDHLEISAADPREDDLSDLMAVVSACGDASDDALAARARAHRIPVNVVDRPELSTFIFPAIVDRGEVIVAIGTGGAAPVLARRLRERIEALIPARIGGLAALLGRYRARAARARRGTGSLRAFWERVIDGPIGAAALAGRWHEAEAALARASDDPDARSEFGTVFLVGAGPGDPDLLTLRALQALQGADVVFHDEGVGAEILDRARRDAERICIGRSTDRQRIGADAAARMLAAAAREGRNTVRLTVGDASAVDRSGAIDHLRRAGIAVVVVPGVAPAAATELEIAA
jgi:uroporphyrin-III C-methyltransferase / precorrin-2 dehydrogenase / sirohydrochlorin ferrochelatase